MKNKNSYILFIIVLFVCLVTSGVVAFYSTSVSVAKKINMGLVDVQLKTFVDVDGVNVEYTSNDLEITNEQFSYIPIVYNKNNSGDCFVRVKTYINTSNTSKVVTTNDVYNLNNTVMYGDDGYFYYKSILSPSDNVKIYDGLILDNLNNYKNETLRVVTVVETIQAKNMRR